MSRGFCVAGVLFLFFFAFSAVSGGRPYCPELIIEPGKVVEWDVFVVQSPRFSIAGDGYVRGRTRRDLQGPRLNLNHHEDVDRLSTSSTTEQAQIEIKMGLFESFQENGEKRAILHVNDCDQDVCSFVWLFRKPEMAFSPNERVGRFLLSNDRMDRSAGMYPLTGVEVLAAREWVFQPYRHALATGLLEKKNPLDYRRIIDEVGLRIDDFVDGKMPLTPVPDGYEEVGGGLLPNGARWIFVREEGSGARMRLVREGTRAFAFLLAPGRYSIGRTSDWVPFPLEKIFARLNAAEPAGLITAANRWGGSDTIGGSPRLTGSKLTVLQVQRIIQEVLDEEWR